MEPIAFGVTDLSGNASNNPTAIDFSKSGNPVLFVAQQDGSIYRYEVERQPDGPDADSTDEFVATSTLLIDAIPEGIQNYDDGGAENGTSKRLVTGMVVTQDADGNDVLYVSSSDWRIAVGEDVGLDTNSSQINRLTLDPDTGAVLSNVAVLRGLPRSEENHAVNGLDLAVDPATGDVIMYAATGGITNKGAPGNNFAGTTDFAWSGAIIRINLTELEAYDIRTDAAGNQFILDLPTLDDPSRSNVDLASLGIQDLALDPNFTLDDNGSSGGVLHPDWAGGNNGLNQAKITDYVLVSDGGQLKLVSNPVELFAPGYRNSYDVIALESGELFTWDNGPNGGWGGQPLSYSDGNIVDDWTTEYATNEFNESGSSGFGDQLHYLGNTGDAYGTYGGHASPLRAAQEALQAAFNSDGSYKGASPSDPIIADGVQIFDDEADARAYLAKLLIIYEQNGSGDWVDVTAQTGLPPDLFDVLSGYNWKHPGSSISNPLDFHDGSSVMDGTPYSPESQLLDENSDGSLVVTPESTNGLTEYTATYFDGALQGTIAAASFDETIYFAQLADTDGDGRTDSASIVHTISLNGSNPLALVALPDHGLSPVLIDNDGDGIDDFSGVIALATYGADVVTFLVPGGTPLPPTNDMDEDGLNDIIDSHAGDPLDGLGVQISQGGTARWDFELSNPDSTPPGAVPPGNSIAGDIGINAAFRDNVLPAADNGGDETAGLFNGGVFNLGGASSFVSLDVAHDGQAEGAANSQQDVLGIGFAAPDAQQLTIQTEMVNIFTYSLNTDPPAKVWNGGEKVGLVVGPGDQFNFAEAAIAVVDDGGTLKYGVQILVETNDSFITDFVEIPGIENPVVAGVGDPNFQVAIDLDLTPGAETASARARYVDDGSFTNWVSTAALALPPAVAAAVKGTYDNQGATTGAFVGMLASAPDGDDSFAASWDWIDVQNPDVPTGAARIGITETSDNINKSTFDAESFEITNVGDKVITQVEFDIAGGILPDAVFDPFGDAGDTVSKELTIDSSGGTGVDTTPDASTYIGAGGPDGYEGLLLTFDQALNGGFEPGETVTFSIDADPNSVQGASKSLLDAGASLNWDVGGISGAELIGGTVTVTYADGTTSIGSLISAGNDAGAFTLSAQDTPGQTPGLAVNGLGEGSTGTYGPGGPSVVVSGPAGQTARVTLGKGFIQPETNEFHNGDADDQAYAPQLDAQLAELAASDFPANNLAELQTVDVLLDGTNQDITSLFDFSGVADYDFAGEAELPLAFVASIIDPADADAPQGATTQPVFLTFDPNAGNTDPFRVEAEAMDIVSGFTVMNNGHASNGQYLQAGGSGEQRASYSFAGASGSYNLTIGHYDESDGQSQMSVLVNGSVIDTFTWDADAGDAKVNQTSFAEHTVSGVSLSAGDVVEISGFPDGGEPLRTDYIDFFFTGGSGGGGDTTPPVVQSSSAPDVGAADEGGASTQITVTFADNAGIATASIGTGDITVTGPGGPLTVSAASVNIGSNGSPRTATYTVDAPGGSWDAADEGAYTVALKGGEVLDTSGNAAAADPALDSFTVDLSVTPPEAFRVEAETMTIVSGFVVMNNPHASGGQYLQASNSSEQRASYSFSGTSGSYDLTIGHFDESDGQSQLSLIVNGSVIDTFTWDADAGDASVNPTSFAEYTVNGVALSAGDVIEIAGFGDGNEPLRTDFIDFLLTGGGADTEAPVVQAASAPDISAADEGGASTQITVTFADNAAIATASIGTGDITVTGPGGPLTVSGVSLDQGSNGSPRTATYTVDAPGGSWDAADEGAYTVALKGGEVLDTSGNAAAADPALESFTVDLSVTPPDPFRVEAETMTIVSGFMVMNNGHASNGQYLQAGGSGEQRASYTFTEAGGSYDLTIGHYDESDGQSQMSLWVNGGMIGSFTWDADAGASTVNQTSFAEYTFSGVSLSAGDVIEISGFGDGLEPLRTDFIDFQFTGGSGGPDTQAPFVQSSSAPGIGPGGEGGASTQVSVTFADNAAIAAASIDPGDITVTGPGGPLTVSAVSLDNSSDGTPRTATYTVDAPGGSWDAADEGAYTVALEGGEVLDTSGNASAADPALDSFTVDFSAAPPDPFRVEAETFDIVSGFMVMNNGHASNGQYLQAGDSGEQRASYTFTGTSGDYDLTIGHYDESDGQSQLSLIVNGTVIDTFIWDADAGDAKVNPTSFAEHTVSGVALSAGDVIELSGFGDGLEPLRTDFIDFVFADEVIG